VGWSAGQSGSIVVNRLIGPVARVGEHVGSVGGHLAVVAVFARVCEKDAASIVLDLDANFDGRAVTYGFGELNVLVPAYAATIHKSQGSEYPAVVIPIMTQHYAMLQRNLLYTGVTRGKRLVVLVGQKKAVAIAVRNVSGRRRWSKLREWLRLNPSLSRQIGVTS
jgi:UvrD-like helicase C-terminal domain